MGNNFLSCRHSSPSLTSDHSLDEQPVALEPEAEAEANVNIDKSTETGLLTPTRDFSNSQSESESDSHTSTDEAQAQLQTQNWELRGVIAKLRNQNASVVLENETLRRELHTLRFEMQEVVNTLGEYSREWNENEKQQIKQDTSSPETEPDELRIEGDTLIPELEPVISKTVRDGEEWVAARKKEQAKGLLAQKFSGRKVSAGGTPIGKWRKLWKRKPVSAIMKSRSDMGDDHE